MKARTFTCITAMIIFAALIASFRSAAQAQANNLSPAPLKYTVKVLPGPPGLGGFAFADSINNRGWLTGLSNPPDGSYEHAILWREYQPTDLGTLGGYNSTGPLNNRNERGWVVGTSETADIDPYQENFAGFICPQSIFPQCLPLNQTSKGFLWRSETNEMVPLPPLVPPLPGGGGNNSFGSGANNQEMFGFAENGVGDPNCVAPQMFDFEGVVWSLSEDGTPFVSRRFSPIEDDTASTGSAINEAGDIVGASGPCAPHAFGTGIAKHAVLWKKDGRVIDLGNLGGTTNNLNNLAVGINHQGQVVGYSALPGDKCLQSFPNCYHAFLWKEGERMQDLGALPGDDLSGGGAINDKGEVVGTSCNSTSGMCRSFHWQGGVMTEINPIFPAGSPLAMVTAADINSRGEIAAQACDATGLNYCVAAVLIPEGDENGPLGATAQTENVQPKVGVLPENIRQMLQRRLRFGRFAPLTRPQ